MDSVLQAIATALATTTVGALAAGGRRTWRALIRHVRARLAIDPAATEALEAAHQDPANTNKVASLAHELARAERDDPEFGRHLRRLWAQAADEARAESGRVTNQISGTVGGQVLQARDVHGGVTFGSKQDDGTL